MSTIFKFADWTVQNLVNSVDGGVLQLPDLQRPFVWPKTKVRDLLDSMYRGYPVGELMFWSVAQRDESRAIGLVIDTTAVHQIVDGQQRLTSLFAVLKGKAVRDSEYNRKSITIAFKPSSERFEVSTPVIAKSAEWIADISTVFADPFIAHLQFKERYEEVNGELTLDEQKGLSETLARLGAIQNYVFKVVEIQASADKETVADIFVRINSEGVSLKAADFILTWLSVFWPEGRERLEAFARDSRVTADRASELAARKVSWTPRNHYLTVDAGQLVRVLVAVGQNRAKLGDAYKALQAKDRSTGFVVPQKQKEELDKLKAALPIILNPLHWDEFVRCLPTAGFRSRKMITSTTNLLSGYAIWLLGRTRFGVDLPVLRNLIARWFFMSQLTWRYTGSGETQLQKDLDRLETLAQGDSVGFRRLLEGVIASELSENYWTLRMPDALISSAAALSPAYQSYLAALNILDADMFMLTSKVRDWMDPTATAIKGLEGHHLFPVQYQKSVLGATDNKRINQVANFAPTDWDTNLKIRDRAPADYWPELVSERTPSEALLKQQMAWHALPDDWERLGYDEFLHQRRLLMAQVTRSAFERLSEGAIASQEIRDASSTGEEAVDRKIPDVGELIDAGVLRVGDVLTESDPDIEVEGEITEDRQLRVGDNVFDSIDDAARGLGVSNVGGAEFWMLEVGDELVSVAQLIAKLDTDEAA